MSCSDTLLKPYPDREYTGYESQGATKLCKIKNKKTKDVLPEDFKTLEEFSEFWDTHSTADAETLINLWLQEELRASA